MAPVIYICQKKKEKKISKVAYQLPEKKRNCRRLITRQKINRLRLKMRLGRKGAI